VNRKVPQLYAVGSIVKAYGIRGEVVVQHLTDSTDRFRTLRKIWLGADTVTASETRIERASVDARGVRLKLKGVNTRTDAEALKGTLLFVDEQHKLHLPAGRYFVHDVIGLDVRDDRGRALGSVADVLHTAANDLYVVRGNGTEFMIPAVREFIASIDLERRTMTVHLIDGLLP
jgi:16S rRNA processing protein RimM